MTEFYKDENNPNLRPVGTRDNHHGWKKSLAVLPAVGAVMVPGITCPACWPGYAAILSSLGIGFIPSTRYLLPLTAACLAFFWGLLAWEARKQHRFGPLALATFASAGVLFGRFYLGWSSVMYGGVVLLVAASLWNAWPAILSRVFPAQTSTRKCPACRTAAQPDKIMVPLKEG